MKKLFVFVLVLAFVSLQLLTAGGNRDSAGRAGGDSEGIGGSLLIWLPSNNDAVAEALIKAFNAIHPDVLIEYQTVSRTNARQMVTLAGPSGVGPDVFSIPHDQASLAINDGILEPLPRSMQQRLIGRIYESAMGTIIREGTLYGVLYQIENPAFFYNKDLVSRPPQSFEEIIAFARTWNNPANSQYAFRFPVNSAYNNYIFFTPYGYSLFGPNMDDWRNPGFDSPAVARGLAFHISLRQIFNFPSADATSESTVGAFIRGEVPFTITGPWDITSMINAGLNFGITRFPTINGVQPVGFSGVQIAVVSSYSTNFPAAFAFAEFMASEEAASIYYTLMNSITSLVDTSGVPGLSDDEYVQGILQQTPYSVPMPMIPEISAFWPVMMDMLSFTWDGLLTIEQAQAKAMDDYELLMRAMGQSMYD